MYVRARPIVNREKLSACLAGAWQKKQCEDETELYFNSASAGLKWLLIAFRERASRPLKVAVQVLTCESVKSAIEESGNIPVYMDISEGHFTTLLPVVSALGAIDILLLSHLYGLANPDYLRIKEWCSSSNVILVNDLAQTVDAEVEGETIESHDDYYLHSFGFDKPISAGSGGMLKVRRGDEWLVEKYADLPKVTDFKSKFALKKFALYYSLTSGDIYKSEFRRDTMIENAVVSILDTGLVGKPRAKALHKLLSSTPNRLLGMVERVARLLSSKFVVREIPIRQLGTFQVAYLHEIRGDRKLMQEKYLDSYLGLALNSAAVFQNVGHIAHYSSPYARCGQRITILHDERSRLIEEMRTRNIEAGAFNWPRLICADNQNEQFPNASRAIATLVNVPTWASEIWK